VKHLITALSVFSIALGTTGVVIAAPVLFARLEDRLGLATSILFVPNET
jgi:hypothetical protein